MIRFLLTLAAAVSAVLAGLTFAADVGTMVQGYAYRQACVISAAQFDEPVSACGRTR